MRRYTPETYCLPGRRSVLVFQLDDDGRPGCLLLEQLRAAAQRLSWTIFGLTWVAPAIEIALIAQS